MKNSISKTLPLFLDKVASLEWAVDMRNQMKENQYHEPAEVIEGKIRDWETAIILRAEELIKVFRGESE